MLSQLGPQRSTTEPSPGYRTLKLPFISVTLELGYPIPAMMYSDSEIDDMYGIPLAVPENCGNLTANPFSVTNKDSNCFFIMDSKY